jgi:hypothetical protein
MVYSEIYRSIYLVGLVCDTEARRRRGEVVDDFLALLVR